MLAQIELLRGLKPTRTAAEKPGTAHGSEQHVDAVASFSAAASDKYFIFL